MKILAFSSMKKEWFRTGTDIRYEKATETTGKKDYYTLSFTHTFEFTGDTVTFAYSYPYTYSDLRQFINTSLSSHYLSRERLCRTIAGYDCDILTITSEKLKKKQGVVFTGRVHPGETVGSWMLHGAIEFLLSEDPIAVSLRDKFIFYIIPMLNPDGVIQGNYRNSLAGCDLNRKYLETTKVNTPI